MSDSTREIKFRAWHNDHIWYQSDEQSYHDFMISPDGVAWFRCEPGKANGANRGAVLMQYTGMKDKNGREIYEGDIVTADNLIAAVKWSERKHGWVCRWEARRKYGPTVDYGEPELGWRQHEIIGNIHENPELLK